MNDKRQGLFKAIRKSVFHHNPSGVFIILSIALSVFIPSVFLSARASILNSITESAAEVYGEFDHIYYTDLDSTDADVQENINLIMSDQYMSSVGKLEIAGMFPEDEEVLYAGYADETAIDLGNITLISGHFPEKPGQIVLTESALEYADNIIEELGFEADIVGVAADYGRLWPRGKKQNDSYLDNIDIFLYPRDMEALREKNGINLCIFLISGSYASYTADIEDMYENYNWENADLQKNSYESSNIFLMICCSIGAFLLLGTMLLCGRPIMKKYRFILTITLSRSVNRHPTKAAMMGKCLWIMILN